MRARGVEKGWSMRNEKRRREMPRRRQL